MLITGYILGIVACTVAITFGSSWLVDSAAKIAKKFNISELVIGLTVVAFGTSAPEFAVSISAALQNYGDVSVGNIVGSNIFNLGFILGGCALIVPIQTSPLVIKRDGTFLIAGTVLLCLFIPFWASWLFFLTPGVLTQIEGIILFALLAVYLLYLYFKRSEIDMDELPADAATWKDGGMLLLGLLLVVGGAHFLVEFAVVIAKMVGISNWVISVTIVAAGTSIPEVATSLTAALKGRYGISAGNLIGSDIFNMYGVLGLAAIINPLEVDPAAKGSVLALFLMVVLALFFMRTGWRVSRFEGFLLVMVAMLRWGYDLREAILPRLGLTEAEAWAWLHGLVGL